MMKFTPVNFRCECLKIFLIQKPEKMICPHCQKEHDFIFLSDRPTDRKDRLPTPELIVDHTKKLTPSLRREIRFVRIRSRDQYLVLRRAKLIHLLRNDLGYTFSRIGSLIKRDHSSVVHLYHQYRKTLENEALK